MSDENEITTPSDEAFRAALDKGIAEFNRKDFFQCHETLEDLWRVYHGPERECIQGVIQIAVGYYHHGRGNQVGALKLLRRGLERVRKFEPCCLSLDTKALADAVSLDIEHLCQPSADAAPTLKVPPIGYVAD